MTAPVRHWVVALLALVAIAAGTQLADAQRRITPVTPPAGKNENASTEFDRSRLKEIVDERGNIVLIDTVAGTEYADTTMMTKVIGMIYPRIQSLTIGVNVWDAAMRALGQDYGLAGVRASLSLHNRYMPFVELGLSQASVSPDGANYHFRSGVAPYLKLGFHYNIFYNSNPDYQLTFGLRYGLTNFSYAVDDVTVDEGYWHEPSHFSLPSQRVTAGYAELAVGLKVKIAGPVSMGWDLIYHSRLHESHNTCGAPMVIPGYGKRNNSFAVNLMVMYTLDLSKGKTAGPDSGSPESIQY